MCRIVFVIGKGDHIPVCTWLHRHGCVGDLVVFVAGECEHTCVYLVTQGSLNKRSGCYCDR